MNKTLAIVSIALMTAAALTAEDYGARAARNDSSYTLEEMLLYALQDEHLALAEYEAIQEAYGVSRPYSNIAQAEMTHIGYVEGLYDSLGMTVPAFDASAHTIVPASLQEAAEIGVQAEIDNIAMYEQFLSQDLPADVREIFGFLKDSSEKHLTAFERQVERGATGLGRGRTDNSFEGRGQNRTDDHHWS
ncbi:MAG: hypothetical protein JXA95_17340 [Spirochaetales bacterium]|nr:hypothetical protein [Spirochaetales bacterium]